MREPRLAIFGGPDGLDLYRKLFMQAQAPSEGPRFILTEAMPPQHSDLMRIAADAGYTLTGTDDFIQVFTTA
jgi:methylase of polypeptide subunit release factors